MAAAAAPYSEKLPGLDDLPDDMNDLLTMDEVLQNEAKNHGKYAIRVNKWNVGETDYNDPGNLHIQRTNPYVEEL